MASVNKQSSNLNNTELESDSVYIKSELQHEESDEEVHVERAPRRRKCKNRLAQLAEKFPGVMYQLVALYGPEDDQIYVMEVEINGKIFQGIGPSKIKAKVMAAEYALINLGLLNGVSIHPHLIDPASVNGPEDYCADLPDCSTLFYDFDQPYPDDDVLPLATEETEAEAESPHVAEESEPSVSAGESGTLINLDGEDEDEFKSRLIGKNPVTIIGELQLEARYELLAETGDQLHPMFAMAVTINGDTYSGAGASKKIAKARAARKALTKLYNLEFGIAENGMPIYEGDEMEWEKQKAKLESEAELQLEPGRNAMLIISEYFPEAKVEHDTSVDASNLYSARVTVFNKEYSGVGTTKTDARTNAAANALEDLRVAGLVSLRERKLAADRRELAAKRAADFEAKAGELKTLGGCKNAISKLNILYRGGVNYTDIAETPVRHTSFTAFTVAVSVDGRHFAGVGKTKKLARAAAAERALRALGHWTEEDDAAKWDATAELDLDAIEVVQQARAKIAEARMQQGWLSKGSGGGWNGAGPQWGRAGHDAGGWGGAPPACSAWDEWNRGPSSGWNPAWNEGGYDGSRLGHGGNFGNDRGGRFRGSRGAGGFGRGSPNDTWNASDKESESRLTGRGGRFNSRGMKSFGSGAFDSGNEPRISGDYSRLQGTLLPTPEPSFRSGISSHTPDIRNDGGLLQTESSSPWNYILDNSTGIYRSTGQAETYNDGNSAGFSSGNFQSEALNYPQSATTDLYQPLSAPGVYLSGSNYSNTTPLGSGYSTDMRAYPTSGTIDNTGGFNQGTAASYGTPSVYTAGTEYYGFDNVYNQGGYGYTGSYQ